MPVVRVAVQCPRAHDQLVFERAGNGHLHPELVRLAGLALADAVHFPGVPGVKLGLSVGCLALAALAVDACGLAQGLSEGLSLSGPDVAGLALDLASQAAHDGALAPVGLAHGLELARVGIASSLAAQMLALLGKGLLQIDSDVLARLHQLDVDLPSALPGPRRTPLKARLKYSSAIMMGSGTR